MFEQELIELKEKLEAALITINASGGPRVSSAGPYMSRREARQILLRAQEVVIELTQMLTSIPLPPQPIKKIKLKKQPEPKPEEFLPPKD